jgi:hypothetical protein
MPSIRPRACSNTFSAGTGSSPPLGWIIADYVTANYMDATGFIHGTYEMRVDF